QSRIESTADGIARRTGAGLLAATQGAPVGAAAAGPRRGAGGTGTALGAGLAAVGGRIRRTGPPTRRPARRRRAQVRRASGPAAGLIGGVCGGQPQAVDRKPGEPGASATGGFFPTS